VTCLERSDLKSCCDPSVCRHLAKCVQLYSLWDCNLSRWELRRNRGPPCGKADLTAGGTAGHAHALKLAGKDMAEGVLPAHSRLLRQFEVSAFVWRGLLLREAASLSRQSTRQQVALEGRAQLPLQQLLDATVRQ
jgi:hypothetical protein